MLLCGVEVSAKVVLRGAKRVGFRAKRLLKGAKRELAMDWEKIFDRNSQVRFHAYSEFAHSRTSFDCGRRHIST
jgi:hypothetical protein